MTEQKRLDPSIVETLYPALKGLYIPSTGEIVMWGKGTAIVTQSPLDASQPLMVISLNAGIHGPFEVKNSLSMGPYEGLPIGHQEELIGYFDRNFDGRFSTLFQKFPGVKDAWEAYKKRFQMESETSSPAQGPQ